MALGAMQLFVVIITSHTIFFSFALAFVVECSLPVAVVCDKHELKNATNVICTLKQRTCFSLRRSPISFDALKNMIPFNIEKKTKCLFTCGLPFFQRLPTISFVLHAMTTLSKQHTEVEGMRKGSHYTYLVHNNIIMFIKHLLSRTKFQPNVHMHTRTSWHLMKAYLWKVSACFSLNP